MLEGKFAEAEKFNGKLLARPGGQLSYQPIGDLIIESPAAEKVEDYRRDLGEMVAATRKTGAQMILMTPAPYILMIAVFLRMLFGWSMLLSLVITAVAAIPAISTSSGTRTRRTRTTWSTATPAWATRSRRRSG